jgi:hypothetical protein
MDIMESTIDGSRVFNATILENIQLGSAMAAGKDGAAGQITHSRHARRVAG